VPVIRLACEPVPRKGPRQNGGLGRAVGAAARMEKIVPAVSSEATGPLGVTHLPRLYVKAILKATDSLADGWNSGNRGMDKWVLDDLEIDYEPFFAFLGTIPTYAETETWVRTNARKIDAAAIAAHNKRVRDFDMPEENAAPRRAEIGIDASVTKGVMLNDLDDYACFHAAVTSARGAKQEPIVPLVSMQAAGPLGIRHLPRMWAKGIIHGVGALPDQWRSGPVRVVYTNGVPALVETPGGVDAMTVTNLGIDMHAMCQYLLAQAPTYLEFEDWVKAHAAKADAKGVTAHNDGPWKVEGERPAAELKRLGYPEMTSAHMFMYNDLGDWDALRAQMLARRGTSKA
jgi:hypothetical protein